MLFNTEKFKKLLIYVYPDTDGELYKIEDAYNIFMYFFEKYEENFESPHPPLSRRQIESIIDDMPYIFDSNYNRWLDLSPEDYEPMIDRYFETDYCYSDYNISHFFSGRVREIKYFETCY